MGQETEDGKAVQYVKVQGLTMGKGKVMHTAQDRHTQLSGEGM